ncbi:helix-turn-helix domain-containing protein [Ruegeria sp. EL01]|uniref:helix-turn-helix domain-containing protein n=1 Tax=Ruegeria sp. EL01 TaxID=2107578 RepID=UPI00352C1B93
MRYCILENLADPDLSSTDIAQLNSISIQYLHKLFSTLGLSVSRWIRKQRLNRCRTALLSGSRQKSITEIAFDWGFNDASHFSRIFRAEFGTTPRSLQMMAREEHSESFSTKGGILSTDELF